MDESTRKGERKKNKIKDDKNRNKIIMIIIQKKGNKDNEKKSMIVRIIKIIIMKIKR